MTPSGSERRPASPLQVGEPGSDAMTIVARPTRVLHLSITPRGGWHSHAVALVERLADQSAEQHMLAHWPGATTPRNAATTELRCTWLGPRATGGLVTLRQIGAMARDGDLDWVQIHGLPSEPFGFGFALAAKLALFRSGAALAVTPHNAFGRRGPVEFRRLRQATLRLFDRVFVFSDDDRRWAGPRAVLAPFVLPSAIERPTRPRSRRSSAGPTIACLPGQIRADKGFHLVPAALAGQDYAIRIAGPDKGGFAELEACARDHGVPLLGRPGFAEEEQFQAAIAQSDVVVLPYTRVTQSAVLAYARAAGIPVAASMALKEAGLAADAYFELGDNRSLLAAVEQAARSGRTPPPHHRSSGPPRGEDQAQDRSPVAADEAPLEATGLYERRDRLTDLVDDLADASGVFVVGSPRAGTTIVARWLADRLGVDLGPETHYFTLVSRALAECSSRDEAERRLRHSGAYADAADEVAADITDTWWSNGSPIPLSRYLADRGSPWVEKTPAHLRHWPELLRFDRRSRILVVTRSVPATLVSQTDVPWLAGRHPRSLLARILADRIHLGLLRMIAPRRVRVLRYEEFVTRPRTLGDGPTASMAHETWKALSDQRHVVDDRNRAAEERKPTTWRVGASSGAKVAAIPGALARVGVDLARSLSAGRSRRRPGRSGRLARRSGG